MCYLCFGVWNFAAYGQEGRVEPITVNGDKVEYSADSKEITAVGNVEVIYKGARLTCKKLTVNSVTKEAVAEGDARLDDQKGIIEGSKIIYNFQTKTGTIVGARFRSNPYFLKTKRVEKISDNEFVALGGYATTCNFDQPHYRIGAKQINIVPKDKIQIQEAVFYAGKTPLIYFPRYNHSLRDPLMHVQVMPGTRKDWGPYLLTSWRYNLADNINGRIYLDYRNKLGWAEGYGFNYLSQNFGKGDFKFYYTDERPGNLSDASHQDFQRYLTRWRHKWEIDTRTMFVSEFYKISDEKRKQLDAQSNMLKDYFYREYEKDSQPLSYALLHHSFQYSSLDLLVQKRTNHWYDQLDKLPEVKFSMPSLQVAETPVYFENESSFANFNKKATIFPVTDDDVTVARLDSTNKLSLPSKLAFLELTPFVADRITLYDKGVDGSSLPARTIFYTGVDLSTKFYRTFEVESNFLGMDINSLRHIITPLVGYAYNHEPTINSSKLRQIDEVDSIGVSNAMNLELSNKLQTKRKGQSVDLLDTRVSTSYIFKPKTGDKSGSHLSDFLFEIKLLPYSWLRFEGDATYNHSVSRSDPNYNKFSTANYDINFDFGKERSFGIGQRYERSGGNEITFSFNWRLTPKWKFSTYHRYNITEHDPSVSTGFREQQYTLTRDLHCWDMDITFSSRQNGGTGIFFLFRLKAFPEMQFGTSQSFHSSRSGSQNN